MLLRLTLVLALLIPGCLASNDEAAPAQPTDTVKESPMPTYDALLGAVVKEIKVFPGGQVGLLLLQKNGEETLVIIAATQPPTDETRDEA